MTSKKRQAGGRSSIVHFVCLAGIAAAVWCLLTDRPIAAGIVGGLGFMFGAIVAKSGQRED